MKCESNADGAPEARRARRGSPLSGFVRVFLREVGQPLWLHGPCVVEPPWLGPTVSSTQTFVRGACDLESVIATAELDARPSRRPNQAMETGALLQLLGNLAEKPEEFFQKLVEATLELSNADSSGISILNERDKCFVWPAVAGPLSPYLWEGTPQDFGPCGTVLERDRTLMMVHPERHFAYLTPISPSLEEVLLVPFYMEKKAVGTIWAVIHTEGKKFDAEDKRLLESLSTFAASAYLTLVKAGGLEPMLTRKAVVTA